MTPEHPPAATASVPLAPGESFHRLAHDLNNALGIILGNAELLMDTGSLDAKSLRRAEAILRAAGTARDLVGAAQERYLR
jgi:hypothetical protein